jgi:enolase
MAKIKDVSAREILDSRGQPAVEVQIFLDNGLSAIASASRGFSRSRYEEPELRDGDKRRYQGQGVLRAIKKIQEEVTPALKNRLITEQKAVDDVLADLDGSHDKPNLGANVTLAVSVAAARAAALSQKEELFVYLNKLGSLPAVKIPVPIFNVFNGGCHADTNLDFEEFLFIPKADSAAEMIRQGAEVFQELGAVLSEAGYDTDTGIQGGYASDLDSSLAALELIMAAAVRVGYKPRQDFNLGLDIGSSLLYDPTEKKYIFPLDHAYFSSANLIGLYNEWLKQYPLVYLEDGLAEDAWEDWRELTAALGKKLLIAGGDLFATSSERLRQGLSAKAANAIIIKPSQAGTIAATLDCLKLAQKHNYKIIVAGRSGETNDDFIVDLAVASGADYLKAGSLSRGERVSKYNRLMAIAEIIKEK